MPVTPTPPTPSTPPARAAVFGYFFVLGAATATWNARLPAIKATLHLTDGRLGLALFAVPAGSVLTLVLSGRIVDAFGDVRVLRIAAMLVCVALVPIGLARDLPALMAALVCYGAVVQQLGEHAASPQHQQLPELRVDRQAD